MEYEYPKPLKPEWITQKDGIDDLVVGWAKSFGKYLATKENIKIKAKQKEYSRTYQGLSTSQLRKFFGEMKQIQSDFQKYQANVPLLKAKLAYAVGRDFDTKSKTYSSKIDKFYEQMELGINAIQGEEANFKRFVQIVEAVVAFHKYFDAELNKKTAE